MKYIMCVAILSLFSCASIHEGSSGKVLNGTIVNSIKVSAQNIEDPTKKAYQLIEITIENNSDEWLKIKKGEIIIETANASKISQIQGSDLVAWGKAKANQLKIDQHNKDMVQGGLLVAGSAAMKSTDKNVNLAGSLAVLGTVTWAVTDIISMSFKNATQTNGFPEEHIQSEVSVPGKMFTRRWVLLNKKSDENIHKLVFSLETLEGEKSFYEISL